ncbi:MAG: hypothetical protein H7A48_08705 [Akkermansiaceae bacterium]|nr:hypothetical protein [Akkermansiaceae bacterium]MCP5548954.1 hypothetical protein [Akkermansiaceae bacterium]
MKPSQKSSSSSATGGIGVDDILFILFKHKWMILLLALVGFGAAAAVHLSRVPLYQSEAKLFVRYVIERSSADQYQSQSSPGAGRVDPVINTEVEILTSMNLSKDVAEKIGPARILPEAGPSPDLDAAAGKIRSDLQVGVGQSNNVLRVVYGNEDPKLAKEILSELVKRYCEEHIAIHRNYAAKGIVEKQADEVKERLDKYKLELKNLRTEYGRMSLEEATGALAGQRSRIEEELMTIKAELAAQKANLATIEKLVGEAPKAVPVKGEDGKPQPIPTNVVTEYKTTVELLPELQRKDMELRMKFTPGNRLVELNRQQIANLESRRKALVEQHPGLEQEVQMAEKDDKNPHWNLINEQARMEAILAKKKVYEDQLEAIKQQFGHQYVIGEQIEEFEGKKKMAEAEYRSLQDSLKNADIDRLLGPSQMPNINVVQDPTEPIKTYDDKSKKLILGLAGGGLALGLGLAFLIELLLDRRVKRPVEIQTRLQLPLLLTIPMFRRRENPGLFLGHAANSVPRIGAGPDAGTTQLAATGNTDLAESDPTTRRAGHFILPYAETIRDRIIFNFEINDVTHKPKLVAVTGLSEGAGASTIAAGLAKSFADIQGSKVLLVDLSSFQPEENPLYGEVQRHSLNGALHLARNTQFRESQQNLYYASATARRDDSGITSFSPIHLYELMPHLQASQYDYIVFDMPPIDQTSRTLTMAGLMDKVLLVLDAENTSRDALTWGYGELTKGKADVSCIFNKTRAHTPGWLIGEN